jgi:hypothetical protein
LSITRVRLCLIALWISCQLGGAVAFEPALDRRAVEEALSIGQSRIDTERARFHQAYRVVVGVAPVDDVELVTPFRRVEMAAEAKARAGDHSFGLREALQEAATAGEVVLQVDLTFHPFNTLIRVPGYTVALVRSAAAIAPVSVERVPRFGPRVNGAPPSTSSTAGGFAPQRLTEPLTGGVILARFDVASLDPHGVYEMQVVEERQIIAKARIDFARLR